MKKKHAQDKIKQARGKSQITFRTLINICKEHSTLPPAFYRRFNKQGAQAQASAKFDEYAKQANLTTKKKGKKKSDVETFDDGNDNLQVIQDLIDTIDGDDLQSQAKTETLFRMVRELNPTARVLAENAIKKHLKMTQPQIDAIKRALMNEGKEDSDPTQAEVDLIQQVTAAYKKERKTDSDNPSIMYTAGSFFRFNEKLKLYIPLSEHSVASDLYKIVHRIAVYSPGDKPININTIVNESLKRVQLEYNGEDIFAKSGHLQAFDKSEICNPADFNYTMTDIFTNVENAQIASGDVTLYLNNAEVKIATGKKSKSIPRHNIQKDLKGKQSIRDLLVMQHDLDNMKRKGMVSVDFQRRGLFYSSKMNANHMSTKKLLKAINNGGAKNFIHFLDCVTAHLSKKRRAQFIAAYLDMLAYIMQPIKRHSCFFMMYGNGENGKSFGNKILTTAIGRNAIESRGLEAGAENPRFFENSLHGKNVIVDDDVGQISPKFVALLKRYSNGNDIISAERKGSDERMKFMLRASMVMLSNRRVSVQDGSFGFIRRAHPFHFGSRIDGTFDRYKHGDVLLRDEIDVVFNLLLLRVPRVVKNGPQHTKDMKHEIGEMTSNGFTDHFLNQRLIAKKGERIALKDVLAALMFETTEIAGESKSQPRTVSFLKLQEIVVQRGFMIDKKKRVINAKLKKK